MHVGYGVFWSWSHGKTYNGTLACKGSSYKCGCWQTVPLGCSLWLVCAIFTYTVCFRRIHCRSTHDSNVIYYINNDILIWLNEWCLHHMFYFNLCMQDTGAGSLSASGLCHSLLLSGGAWQTPTWRECSYSLWVWRSWTGCHRHSTQHAV